MMIRRSPPKSTQPPAFPPASRRRHYKTEALLSSPGLYVWEPFAWLKAGLFWQLLQARSRHQWFVWADCDALYMSLDKSVPDLIRDLGFDPQPSSNTNVVVADDIGDSIFNTGVMLVKNNEWSRDFFANVLRMGRKADVRHHGRAFERLRAYSRFRTLLQCLLTCVRACSQRPFAVFCRQTPSIFTQRDTLFRMIQLRQNEFVFASIQRGSLREGWWEQFAMQELYKENRHQESLHVQIVEVSFFCFLFFLSFFP